MQNDVSKTSVVSEVLVQTKASLDGTPYPAYTPQTPELSVVRFTLQPNAELPWHTHKVPNAAYIISGSITIEKKDGTRKLFNAVEVVAETIISIHRGLVGEEHTTIVTFYAGLKAWHCPNTRIKCIYFNKHSCDPPGTGLRHIGESMEGEIYSIYHIIIDPS